jgi:hypothetical protein
MKRSSFNAVLAFAAAFCVAAAVGEPATNAANKLTLFLSDGSRVVGTSPKDVMPFRAGFGKIEIPLGLVASLTMNRDGETAVVQFRNDDRLTGVPMLDPVAVDTMFGSFKIPLTSIRRFTVSGLSNIGDADLHYGFDDAGEQVPDNCGKNHGGQAVRVQYRADASGDKVAVFGNGAHVIVGGQPIPFDGDFSIAAWICPERPPANEWEPMIVSRWTQQPAKGMRFSVRGPRDGGNSEKLCLVGDSGDVVGFGETRLGQGAWHHVAIVFQKEGQKATFFVDGRVDGTTSGRGSIGSADTEMVVGCASWGRGQNGFVGSMDDLVIAARAMSESDVKALFDKKAARAGTTMGR